LYGDNININVTMVIIIIRDRKIYVCMIRSKIGEVAKLIMLPGGDDIDLGVGDDWVVVPAAECTMTGASPGAVLVVPRSAAHP